MAQSWRMDLCMRLFSSIIVGALVALTGCSRSPQPAGVQTHDAFNFAEDGYLGIANFSSVYSRTLSFVCVECHNPSGMATVNYNVQLNFADRNAAYTTLLVSTVNGVTSAGTCAPARIVAPSQPKVSYLLGTLIPSYSSPNFAGIPNCTPYAGHFSTLNLSPEQRSGLIGWIQSGALDN